MSAIDEKRPCSVSFWRLSKLRSSKVKTTLLLLDIYKLRAVWIWMDTIKCIGRYR